MKRGWWLAWFGAGVLSACLFSAVTDSRSFRECEANRKDNQTYQNLKEKISFFIVPVTYMRVLTACGFVAAGENEGALAGLSGVLVAGFTGTLWWVTWGMARIAKDPLDDTYDVGFSAHWDLFGPHMGTFGRGFIIEGLPGYIYKRKRQPNPT